MKRCPTCNRTYADDAPGFCPNDGSPLAVEAQPAPPYSQGAAPAQTPPAPARPDQNYGQQQWQGTPQQPSKVRGGWAWAIPSLLISLVCCLAAATLLLFRRGFVYNTRYAEDSNFPPVVVGLVLLLLLPALALLLGGVGLFRARKAAGRAVAAAGAGVAVLALLLAVPVHYSYWTTPLGGWRENLSSSENGHGNLNVNGGGYNANSADASAYATPADVWKSFYAAAQRNDVAAIKKMMSREMLARAQAKASGRSLDETISDELAREATHSFTAETRGVFVNGDSAVVEVRDVSMPGEHWTKIPFVKEDGVWKLTR